MPIYNFTCKVGHTTEKRAGYEVTSILCPSCGLPAQREAIYEEQNCITETGYKYARRNEVPRDEKRHDKDFKLFQEACQEVDYVHKQNEEIMQQPLPDKPLWKKARQRARAIQQGIAPPLKGVA